MGHDYPDLNGKTRDDAWALLTEWIKSENLRRHCLGVESAMRAYARRYDEPEEAWAVVGLLHDFDYERHPTREEHTIIGSRVLLDEGFPQWVADALLAHGFDERFPRTTLLDRALFAVDELTGFIAAVTFVRPSKSIRDVKVSSVKKKLKDKAFAAGVNRAELIEGADELGVELDEHIAFIIDAMAADADALGLAGETPASHTD